MSNTPAPRTDLNALLTDTHAIGDFRDDVVVESLRIMQQHPGVEPEDIGVSLCVPADHHTMRLARSLEFTRTFIVIFGFFITTIGVMQVIIAIPIPGIEDVRGVGVLISIAGGFIMLPFWLFESAISRMRFKGLLPRRAFSPWGTDPRLEAVPIMIEDVNTFERQKVYGEDAAMCVFDAQRKRVIIEGLRYRYIIHAEGFDTIAPYPSPRFSPAAVMLTFKIGVRTLRLMLSVPATGSILAPWTRVATSSGFCEKFKHALGL